MNTRITAKGTVIVSGLTDPDRRCMTCTAKVKKPLSYRGSIFMFCSPACKEEWDVKRKAIDRAKKGYLPED